MANRGNPAREEERIVGASSRVFLFPRGPPEKQNKKRQEAPPRQRLRHLCLSVLHYLHIYIYIYLYKEVSCHKSVPPSALGTRALGGHSYDVYRFVIGGLGAEGRRPPLSLS